MRVLSVYIHHNFECLYDDNFFLKADVVRWSINHSAGWYLSGEGSMNTRNLPDADRLRLRRCRHAGPNTMMLFASGVNFGFRNTLPHMFGIGVGFLASCTGHRLRARGSADNLSRALSGSQDPGWRLSRLHRLAHRHIRHLPEAKARSRPMTLLEAAAFQWVNPKAWVMLVTAMGIYTDPRSLCRYGDDDLCLPSPSPPMPCVTGLGRFRLGAQVLAV
jgi:hypothetical protein